MMTSAEKRRERKYKKDPDYPGLDAYGVGFFSFAIFLTDHGRSKMCSRLQKRFVRDH